MFELNDELIEMLARVYLVSYKNASDWGLKWFLQSQFHPESREIAKLWASTSVFSTIDVFRALSLAKAIDSVNSLGGQIVEFGTGWGGTAAFLALVGKSQNPFRKLLLIDTFRGLPQPDPVRDLAYKKGQLKSNVSCVKRILKAVKVEHLCEIFLGDFASSRAVVHAAPVAFAHIDGDLYESTCVALDILQVHMEPTGVIIVDDAWDHSGGVRRALEEYVKSGSVVKLGPGGQILLKASQLGAERTSARPLMAAVDWLRTIEGYQSFLSECILRSNGSELEDLDRFFSLVYGCKHAEHKTCQPNKARSKDRAVVFRRFAKKLYRAGRRRFTR